MSLFRRHIPMQRFGKTVTPTMDNEESGMTLIEVLAAVSIGTLVTLSASMLLITGLKNYANLHYSTQMINDTTDVYWTMEKIAQKSTAAGTETLQSSGVDTIQLGPTAGSVPILCLAVANLQGIAPPSSAVYESIANGGHYIAIGIVPINGRPQLSLIPAGLAFSPSQGVYPPASEVFPLFNGETDFTNSSFTVVSSNEFNMTIYRTLGAAYANHAGAKGTNLSQITYSYMFGNVLY